MGRFCPTFQVNWIKGREEMVYSWSTNIPFSLLPIALTWNDVRSTKQIDTYSFSPFSFTTKCGDVASVRFRQLNQHLQIFTTTFNMPVLRCERCRICRLQCTLPFPDPTQTLLWSLVCHRPVIGRIASCGGAGASPCTGTGCTLCRV